MQKKVPGGREEERRYRERERERKRVEGVLKKMWSERSRENNHERTGTQGKEKGKW